MIARLTSRHTIRVFAAITMLALTACEGISRERADAEDPEERMKNSNGKLFGDINLLGGQSDQTKTMVSASMVSCGAPRWTPSPSFPCPPPTRSAA